MNRKKIISNKKFKTVLQHMTGKPEMVDSIADRTYCNKYQLYILNKKLLSYAAEILLKLVQDTTSYL